MKESSPLVFRFIKNINNINWKIVTEHNGRIQINQYDIKSKNFRNFSENVPLEMENSTTFYSPCVQQGTFYIRLALSASAKEMHYSNLNKKPTAQSYLMKYSTNKGFKVTSSYSDTKPKVRFQFKPKQMVFINWNKRYFKERSIYTWFVCF